MSFVPGPLWYTVRHFHDTLTVEYMRRWLEVERNFAILKLKATRISEHCVATLIEDGRATCVTGDLGTIVEYSEKNSNRER